MFIPSIVVTRRLRTNTRTRLRQQQEENRWTYPIRFLAVWQTIPYKYHLIFQRRDEARAILRSSDWKYRSPGRCVRTVKQTIISSGGERGKRDFPGGSAIGRKSGDVRIEWNFRHCLQTREKNGQKKGSGKNYTMHMLFSAGPASSSLFRLRGG